MSRDYNFQVRPQRFLLKIIFIEHWDLHLNNKHGWHHSVCPKHVQVSCITLHWGAGTGLLHARMSQMQEHAVTISFYRYPPPATTIRSGRWWVSPACIWLQITLSSSLKWLCWRGVCVRWNFFSQSKISTESEKNKTNIRSSFCLYLCRH